MATDPTPFVTRAMEHWMLTDVGEPGGTHVAHARIDGAGNRPVRHPVPRQPVLGRGLIMTEPTWWADATEIRVLSLTQPWATLTMLRNPHTRRPVKWVETRSWATRYTGPVAIAATARIAGLRRGATLTIGDYDVTNDTLRGCKTPQYMLRSPRIEWPHRLTVGHVLGVARLAACVPMVAEDDWDATSDAIIGMDGSMILWQRTDPNVAAMKPTDITDQVPYGYFEPGRYGWLLADTQRLSAPIPHKGSLGLLRAPEALLNELKGATAE